VLLAAGAPGLPRAGAGAAEANIIEAGDGGHRALWVVRDGLLSPRAIKRMVADAHRAGITDLLVQVRGRGDAYYESDLVPPALPLRDARRKYGEFDPLAQVIELAHEHGIRVHAWMNMYLVSSAAKIPPGHILTTHPEWAAVDVRGRPMGDIGRKELARELTEGVYLDAGNPRVVRHLTAVVSELVRRYPVDGVHLDYLRFPHLDVGYSESMRAAFRNRHGIDPLELNGNRKGLLAERGEMGYAELIETWSRFKAAQVTALVIEVRQEIRLTRPGVILSAAVKPDPEAAHLGYGQDWSTWIREDRLDVVAPMMYSTSTRVIREQIKEIARTVPTGSVWAGIAVYNQSLDQAAAKIREVRRAGLGGVSIFSYNSLPGGGQDLVRLSAIR